jgi:signal transduction histidine kinase
MSSRSPASLRRRLTISALAGLLLALAAGALGLSLAFEAAVERGFDERLKTVLQTLVAETETAPDGSLGLRRPIGDPRFDQIYSGSYWQVSNAEGVLLRSRSLWDQEIPFDVAMPDGSTLFRDWTNPTGQLVRLAERDLTLPGRTEVLHFIVAGRTAEIDAEQRRFDQLLIVGVLGLTLLLGATIALQVRVGLRPVRDLLDDLDGVRRGQAKRVGEALPVELQPLAVAVNQLLDHDERAIARARDQAADLAHAIKTPLAVLRADLGMIDASRAAGMRERVDLIDGLVRRNLARAAPAGSTTSSALGAPLRAAAVQILALMPRVHAERHIGAVLDVPDDLYVRLDRQDLDEVLGNLLDNAWKWAGHRVRVSAAPIGDRCRLVVEDDGPGLAPEDRERALGRHVRLDEQSPGHGLGLPIARDIVEAAQGSLELAPSGWGGLAVIVELPLAADRNRHAGRAPD